MKTIQGMRRCSYTCFDKRRRTRHRSRCLDRGMVQLGLTVFSPLAIVPGVVSVGLREKASAVLLILCAVAGIALGDRFVAIGMILALIGLTFTGLDGQGKVEAVAPAPR